MMAVDYSLHLRFVVGLLVLRSISYRVMSFLFSSVDVVVVVLAVVVDAVVTTVVSSVLSRHRLLPSKSLPLNSPTLPSMNV